MVLHHTSEETLHLEVVIAKRSVNNFCRLVRYVEYVELGVLHVFQIKNKMGFLANPCSLKTEPIFLKSVFN